MTKITVKYDDVKNIIDSLTSYNNEIKTNFSSTSTNTKGIDSLLSTYGIKYFSSLNKYVDKQNKTSERYIDGSNTYITTLIDMKKWLI